MLYLLACEALDYIMNSAAVFQQYASRVLTAAINKLSVLCATVKQEDEDSILCCSCFCLQQPLPEQLKLMQSTSTLICHL